MSIIVNMIFFHVFKILNLKIFLPYHKMIAPSDTISSYKGGKYDITEQRHHFRNDDCNCRKT